MEAQSRPHLSAAGFLSPLSMRRGERVARWVESGAGCRSSRAGVAASAFSSYLALGPSGGQARGGPTKLVWRMAVRLMVSGGEVSVLYGWKGSCTATYATISLEED
jgi:hypothetical protein